MRHIKFNYFLLFCIILLAVWVRFFHLGSVPAGFIPEEVSTGWDAYSLSKTGADEWGTKYPIIFRETGGYKLTLNGYLLTPVVALFGLSEATVRSTTAFAGVLAVWLTYPVTLIFFKRRRVALLVALLLAISPWHLSMSRYGVDVNWGVPLFLAGLWSFFSARKQPWLLIVSALCFALTYYTYFNYIVFTVLFIGSLFLLSWRWLWQHRGLVVVFLLVHGLFLSPYLLSNNLQTRLSQATAVQSVGLLNGINEHRGACLATYPAFICRTLYNQPLAKIQEITRNFINHFSTTTFFLFGSDRGKSGMPQRWGFLYLFEFPLLMVSLYYLSRTSRSFLLLLIWVILYGVPSSLAGDGHIWRMMTIFPVPQMIVGYGIYKISMCHSREGGNPVSNEWIPGPNFAKAMSGRQARNDNKSTSREGLILKYKRFMIYPLLVLILSFSFFQFLTDYFGYFPYAQAANGYYGFRDLYSYLETVENTYDHVVIAPVGMGFNQLYIYYVFYRRMDPAAFQVNKDVDRRVGEQGWVWVDRIGKYYFVGEADKVHYPLTQRTLLVLDNSRSEQVIHDPTLTVNEIHQIRYPNGDAAFHILEVVKKKPGLL